MTRRRRLHDAKYVCRAKQRGSMSWRGWSTLSRGRGLRSRCTSSLRCWHMSIYWCGRRYWRWLRSSRRYRPRRRRTRRRRFNGLRRQQLRLLWLLPRTKPRTTLHRIRARRHRTLRALSGRLCHAWSTKSGTAQRAAWHRTWVHEQLCAMVVCTYASEAGRVLVCLCGVVA